MNLPSKQLLQQLSSELGFFANAHMRIFWLYLACAILVVGLTALMQPTKRKKIKAAIKPAMWWNYSSAIDLQWYLINRILKLAVLVPLFGTQLAFAFTINRWLYMSFGEGNFWRLNHTITALLFSCCLFISEDFSRFLVHWAQHKLPWLWRFHAIHHSASTLTPLTLYRIHPIELCINSLRSIVIGGAISGLFLYAFSGQLSLIDVLGVNVFLFAFNMAGANLRHSPFYIGFGKAEKLFISPAQHQIHHSLQQRHYDKNFGSCLAIWDKLFGSWLASKDEKVEKFGLDNVSARNNILKQLVGHKA
ncbi:sterol desaturase family protein [Agaribacterium sp. ZY112]|uniref:sterol desaturase family protein n=1 Tax=Agaribacterium sp. ZY112 TaxID=3233574 RepID=UPI00352618A9